MTPLQLEWEPSAADWRDALSSTVRLYRWSPWFAAVLALGSVVLVVVGLVPAGVFGLGAALLIAVVPVYGVWSTFRANPVAASGMTAEVDGTGLRLMTVDGTAHTDLRWPQVTGWRRTRRGFVLRTGPAVAEVYPLPHRAFTGEDGAAFGALLQEQVGPAENG